MPATQTGVVNAFVDAVVARDFARAQSLLHPEVDFRGMTPSRIWEAEGPADVENALRMWLDNPARDVKRVDALETGEIQDTVRTGWLVHGPARTARSCSSSRCTPVSATGEWTG